jgi:hypothetical protein
MRAVLMLLAIAGSARAVPVLLDAGLGTDFPLDVGASARLELPHRILLLGATIGWMPAPYVNTVNTFVVAVGGWNQQTADLIEAALKDSLIVRARAGWRIWRGLEIDAGYALAALGGSVSGADAITAVTGKPVPEGQRAVPLHSTMHAFTAGVGWRWIIDRHWVLRAELEYLQAVASQSAIDYQPRTARGRQDLAALNTALDAYLNGEYTTWVKSPLVSLAFSYRF